WLQRGSCLSIQGDLQVQAPTDGTGPLRPQGRVLLEEGASLVVDGNLTVQGSEEGGSVVCASPLGSSRPLSSAILVKGRTDLQRGVLPGFAWDEPSLAGDNPAEFLLGRLLGGAGANLAKMAGPFRHRLPWIARYETTFQLLVFAELAVVVPGPAA